MKVISLIILAVIFLIENILDAHSTYLVVTNTSIRSEKNPVARYLFRKFGLLKGMILLKTIIVVVLILIFFVYPFTNFELHTILSISIIVYLAVVLNNYRIYSNIKKHRNIK